MLMNIKMTELLKIFNNPRIWGAMHDVCSFLASENNEIEFKKLMHWAENADPYKIKEDYIGRIKGVGINTFQYLRIQSGIDTIMPDKVITKWIGKIDGKVNNPYECIEKGMKIAEYMGITGMELCWAIWIKESGELNHIEIE